jgi:hypothetical protein
VKVRTGSSGTGQSPAAGLVNMVINLHEINVGNSLNSWVTIYFLRKSPHQAVSHSRNFQPDASLLWPRTCQQISILRLFPTTGTNYCLLNVLKSRNRSSHFNKHGKCMFITGIGYHNHRIPIFYFSVYLWTFYQLHTLQSVECWVDYEWWREKEAVVAHVTRYSSKYVKWLRKTMKISASTSSFGIWDIEW